MATTADMRSGLILKIDNNLYTVIEFGQNKTARAAAKVWAKLKGVDNARLSIIEYGNPSYLAVDIYILDSLMILKTSVRLVLFNKVTFSVKL